MSHDMKSPFAAGLWFAGGYRVVEFAYVSLTSQWIETWEAIAQ